MMQVDACQGSDADVIIVSTVRSDVGGHGNKLSGFMLDSRRVNVALSRAKEECIVVGDKNTLRSGGGEMWRDIVDHFSFPIVAASTGAGVNGKSTSTGTCCVQ